METENKNLTMHDLIDFLDGAIHTGRYPASTIVPLRIAVRKIMNETSPSEENWYKIPLSELNLDERMRVFHEKVGDSVSPRTARTYRVRFERAIKLLNVDRKHRQEATDRDTTGNELYIRIQKLLDSTTKDYMRPTFDERIKNILKTVESLQNDCTLSFKYNLIEDLNSPAFEEKNLIYPVFLESNQEAFLILPKNLTSGEKAKIKNRLESALKLNFEKGGFCDHEP